jgi:hypothetical protein
MSLLPAAFAFLAAGLVPAQALPDSSPRISTYVMNVELIPAEKTVRGTQTVTWRNDTQARTQELRFHLYLNAFRDKKSTLMLESDEEFREQWKSGESSTTSELGSTSGSESRGEFGWTSVTSVRLIPPDGQGEPVALETGFSHPDDDNLDDQTVLVVQLPSAVQPGGQVTVEMEFVSFLPKAYRRTGWIPGGGFMCFHWYPILGVLEPDGQGGSRWNCHQFHTNTEFFADFSVYDVKITVPDRYWRDEEDDEIPYRGHRVGATGGEPTEVTAVPTGADGEAKVTLRFQQADVHNFAFVADPNYVRHEKLFEFMAAEADKTEVAPAVAGALGAAVADYDLPEVKMILLLHPEHDTVVQRDRHFAAIEVGLEFYGLRYGAYPYGTVTAVDPGQDIQGRRLGGGMEYPTLFTCGTSLFPHGRANRPEGVTVHEFGHQYWYGLSGNNEFEESWLDEGINSYSESRAQYLAYNRGQMDRVATVDLVQTSSLGLLSVAATRGPWLADDGLFTNKGLPGLNLLPPETQNTLKSVRFEAVWIPDSPVLDLLRSHPTATWYREAKYSSPWDDRARFLDMDNPDPMVMNGWDYIDRGSYRINSYQRPATVLNTLERMAGKIAWWAFMREFHAQARFGHPTTADFEDLLGRRLGADVLGFFRDATAGGARFDYGVHDVADHHVVIRNYGNFTANVQVKIVFEDREEVYETIGADAPGVVHRFNYPDRPVIAEVRVDPPGGTGIGGAEVEEFEFAGNSAGVYLLDANLLNNAWSRQGNSQPALYRALRLLLEIQSELSFAGLIG